MIQTYAADHYAVQAAASHDYHGFYRAELAYRRRAGYPPFRRFGEMSLVGRNEEQVIGEAQTRRRAARANGCAAVSVEAVGPSPAPISRLKGRFRWHILLKGERESLLDAARRVKEDHGERASGDVRLSVDIDPMGML